MASPVDFSRSTSGGTVAGNANFSVTLPASIASGDIIILALAVNNSDAASVPSGWSSIRNTATVNGSTLRGEIWYRNADGSEGTSLTLTNGGGSSVKWSAVAWRITGGDTTTAPVVSTDAVGGTTTPDPVSHSPAGGSKDYLFIWAGHCDNQPTMPPTGQPTGYSNPTGVQSGGTGSAGSKCCSFGASKQATTATEDAGSWTISTASDWIAWTVAVYPAAAVARQPRPTATNFQDPGLL